MISSDIDPTGAGFRFFPNYLAEGRHLSPDTLWLRLAAKSYYPSSWARGSSGVPTKGENSSYKVSETFYFLMPAEFSVGLNHEWDELDDTIASKIRDVGVELNKAGRQIGEGLDLAGLYSGGATWGSLAVKNDSPLIYKNTQRLEFQLNFEFFSHSNPKRDVWEPIDQLQKLSSPTGGGGGSFSVQFGFPYIFDISTITGTGKVVDIIYNDCAITSFMPTFTGPYINGYPIKASLDITFKSIYNTYRNSFNRSGVIEITETSEPADKASAKGQGF